MKRLFFNWFITLTTITFLFAGCSSREVDAVLDDGNGYVASATNDTRPLPTPQPTATPNPNLPPTPASTTTFPTTPTPTSPPTLPQVDTALLTNPSFNNRHARTDTHLFITQAIPVFIEDYGHVLTYALYRLPLDNIALGEVIPLPGEGTIDIVGLCTQYLYVSRRVWQGWPLNENTSHFLCIVYQISLYTWVVSEVVQYNGHSAPFYHAASHSLLATKGDWTINLQLYSYCLQNNEWNYLIDFWPYSEANWNWIQMENDAVLFITHVMSASDWFLHSVYINATLNAKQINDRNIVQTWHTPVMPQNAGEEYVKNLPVFWRLFTTMGDWVYFIHSDGWNERSLYRVRTDGTERTLLQAETRITHLYAFDGSLFAIILGEYEGQIRSYYLHAVRLSPSMETLVHFGSRWIGPDCSFAIQAIPGTDLIAASGGFHNILLNEIVGLYCMRTGAVFIPEGEI